MSVTEIDIDARVGARIHELRGKQGLSLDALARRADVSRAMLSRVERGESSPTAQLLAKICGGLGISLSLLFAEDREPVSPLMRRPDQPIWRDPATGYLRRSISPSGVGSSVDLVEIEFPPGRSVTLESFQPDSWCQHVWVLDGTLELTVGDEVHQLDQGDCLWMRFDRPITFRNLTKLPVRYAVVISRGATKS